MNLFLSLDTALSGFKGIHPTAVIHPSAKIGKNVHIGPYVVIDQESEVGDHTIIHAGSCLASLVKVGSHCVIHSHVTIREQCILGNRVTLQPGAVIGSCGFGYTTDARGEHTKQQQLGIVVLEDDVEIGASTAIDRARFKETRICKGTKIDNLVQIGHNVRLGPFNLIVSQTGISGSVKTGRNVVMGGQTGTVGHIEIADGALFAARSGIKKSIKQAGKYGGNPAISLDAHHREQVYLKRVADYGKKIEALERKIQELEKNR
ncbi:MAG: UDP-3-O-(3-hydroxymyristoyl)glucosamine N-acyltransferase [Rhabdochlamydiaceae bacterium]